MAIDMGGQADLWADMTAATLYAQMLAYWASRKATYAIRKVVVGTVPNATNFEGSATQNAQRLLYNQMLREGAGLGTPAIDGVADVAADTRFTTVQGAILGDGVHPTTVGAKAMADIFLPVVSRVVASL
jgi:lysophospholipase L1-like esterase